MFKYFYFGHIKFVGGDGDRSSVKIGCFFNDIELPLSVKKFMIIWSYVGKESWQLLKPVLEYATTVAPPLHILISLVTEIIAWIRKIKGGNYAP